MVELATVSEVFFNFLRLQSAHSGSIYMIYFQEAPLLFEI